MEPRHSESGPDRIEESNRESNPAQADELSELQELFAELLDESQAMLGLDGPQREAWVSGLAATWRSEVTVEDPAATDRAFVQYCEASGSEIGAIVARKLAAIAEHIDGLAPLVEATDAWQVSEGPDRPGAPISLIIGFEHPEGAPHSLLAEIVDGELVDLNFGDASVEIVPDPDLVLEEMGRHVTVSEQEVAQVGEQIVAAWRKSAATPGRGGEDRPGLVMNQMAAASRLRGTLGAAAASLPEFLAAASAESLGDAAFTEGMSAEEISEANEWARGVLESALRRTEGKRGGSDPVTVSPAMVAAAKRPIRGPIADLEPADQQALCFLEWADWLGVIIGLVRAGADTEVTAASLVDLINRCPEVSTDVPAADREYVEFAFGAAISVWTQGGVVEHGRLTAEGHAALLPAGQEAWSS